MRILATADLHIGRRPGGIREEWARRYSCGDMWLRIADAAIEHQAEAVLLAGDVVDQANQFFEALSPLEEGLRRLAASAIEVVAVSGNHDCDVLAEIDRAQSCANFRLLGRGGQWEELRLPNPEAPRLQLFGWSFPRSVVRESPLTDFPSHKVDPRLPCLGLLHADRNARDSKYAPVTDQELEATPHIRWLIGHVHKPDPLGQSWKSLVPGSPMGLDLGPGECGPHGPLLIDFASTPPSIERLRLAPVRYERPELDLGVLTEERDVCSRFLEAVRTTAETIVDQDPTLEVLCIRPRVTCESRLRADEIHRRLEPLWEEQQPISAEPAQVWVEGVELELRPHVDLAALAVGQGVLAQLALMLQELEDGAALSEQTSRLIDSVAVRRSTIEAESTFSVLPSQDPEADAEQSRAVLRHEAWGLLHELLRERNGDE